MGVERSVECWVTVHLPSASTKRFDHPISAKRLEQRDLDAFNTSALRETQIGVKRAIPASCVRQSHFRANHQPIV